MDLERVGKKVKGMENKQWRKTKREMRRLLGGKGRDDSSCQTPKDLSYPKKLPPKAREGRAFLVTAPGLSSFHKKAKIILFRKFVGPDGPLRKMGVVLLNAWRVMFFKWF